MDQVLATQLNAGERLLWSGQPRQGFVMRGVDIFFIPLALVWAAVPVAMMSTVSSQRNLEVPVIKPEALPFLLVPLLFLFMALYLIVGRFFTDRYHRSGLTYGITDKRVIISSSKVIKRIQSLDVNTIRGLRLDEMPNGTGTIQLTEDNGLASLMRTGGFGMLYAALGHPPMFFQVQDAKRAYGLLCDAARALRSQD